MPDPQASVPVLPTSPNGGSSPPPDRIRSDVTPPKLDRLQGKAPDDDKREAKPEKSEEIFREVVEKLAQAAGNLNGSHAKAAAAAQRVLAEANDEVRVNQRSFQHDLAYAVQDVERARGTPLPLSDQARAETSRLARTAPGLENERMLELLRSTPRVTDQRIVDDIRRTATEVGQTANQAAPAILSAIDVLETRIRLSSRAPDERPTSAASGGVSQPSRPEPASRSETTTNENTGRFQSNAASHAPQIVIQEQGGGPLNAVLRAMRQSGSSNTPPWEPAAQPLGERLSAFEQRMAAGRDEQALRGAERSGRAALDAMEGFRTGEGAVVLNRINDAAKTDPNGMAGVLSEMREGGRFADLRKQFNTALGDERGASAAYERAAGALARYGEDRKAVDHVIARRPDATNLSAKFENLDQEIGSAARDLPSRRDGKSMMDDLSKQVAELLQKAVDSIKGVFTGRSAEQVASSGPSPSP